MKGSGMVLLRLQPAEQRAGQALEATPLGQEIKGGSHPLQCEVSVIIPLPDHRGRALACVGSWAREQTYPRQCFEVIVATDGADPALDSRVQELLGPEDRMICHPGANIARLYDLAARVARGKLLLITESHCIAEPECLEELVRFLAAHDYDGALCRSVPICPNAIDRMEGRMLETFFREWSQEGDWRKTIKHGFAIYRDIYLEEGGVEHTFGHFAEWEFGARLHSRGRRLGYAAAATVRHYYFRSGIKEAFIHVKDWTRGECACRASYPVEYCERYFGYAPEWAQREGFRPSLARSACLASWRSLLNGMLGGGGWSMLQAQAMALLQFLPIALLGLRWRLLRNRWSLWMAMVRCWLWRFNDRKLYAAYCDAWDRMVRYARIQFIEELLSSSVSELPEAFPSRFSEIPEEWLVGFSAVEQWENASFRWSGPVSIVRLRLPIRSYQVRIETRSLRKARASLCLGVFFNCHKVPASSVHFSDGVLSFRIGSAMFDKGPEQRLILTCNPLRPWKLGVPDRRELGLPIFSIEFTLFEETGWCS